MAHRFPTQAELDARPDRVAARHLIAAYVSDSVTNADVVDQLCFHTRAWVVWYEIFGAVCRIRADVQLLATLSDEILRAAAAAKAHEEEDEDDTWADSHTGKMLMQSRESWDRKLRHAILQLMKDSVTNAHKPEFFSNGEPNCHAERRNLLAYLGRMSVAGITACQIYFVGWSRPILEPQAGRNHDEVDIQDLLMIEDYFKITGTWMKSQFDIVPDTHERWQESLTYTTDRWELWKQNLRALGERVDQKRRAKVASILIAMP